MMDLHLPKVLNPSISTNKKTNKQTKSSKPLKPSSSISVSQHVPCRPSSPDSSCPSSSPESTQEPSWNSVPDKTSNWMAWRLRCFMSLSSSLFKLPKPQTLLLRLEYLSASALTTSTSRFGFSPRFQVSRSYARGDRKHYDLFGNGKPGDKDFREAWKKEVNEEEDDCLWTGSEDEKDDGKDERSPLEEEIRKLKQQAREHSDLIDGDDSDELRSVWSESDAEKTLWTGDEGDDDDDIPTEPSPNESSDKYIDKVFEFEETSKYRTISELLKAEQEPEELSPGKQARKIAVDNALKKLKKGPDGRYVNVWEVMSDLDILIGAFENIVSGPEYAELRQRGPKKLNMQFFKDIQARMRDPNYKFSPELKLKPKSKLVPKKRWQKTQSRRRKAQKR